MVSATPAGSGLGIISFGNWLSQNPLFAGEAGAVAYRPSQKVGIAVAVTFEPARSVAQLVEEQRGPTLARVTTYLTHPR